MASSFEKSVKGGTKVKLAAPKSKYVEHILIATHSGEAGVAEIFRALQNRLRDSTWTIVFKSLIIVHLMIREGERDVTLRYLAKHPSKLAISNYSDGNLMYRVLTAHGKPAQMQGRNIRHYTQYLLERAKSYRDTKVDYVGDGEGRLKRLTVEKGLLRETESVQDQITALLKCDILSNDIENEITLTAFRLLVTDLLALYFVMNEGVINLLEHYFEMSRYDAERALEIYKIFSKQTTQVVDYLAVARQYENSTRLEVPKLKHAPTSLTTSLEEYLHDPDFEVNRRQYLAAQEAKRGRGGAANGATKVRATNSPKPAQQKETFPSPKPNPVQPAKQETKGPAPHLIDFFGPIEQSQQTVPQSQTPTQQTYQFPQQNTQFNPATQPYQQPGYAVQPGGFVPQPMSQPQQFAPNFVPQMNPQINPQMNMQMNQPPQPQMQQSPEPKTFGTFPMQAQQSFSSPSTLSPIPQSNVASFQPPLAQQQFVQQPLSNPGTGQQQTTNPFRQSVMPTSSAAVPTIPYASSPQVPSLLLRQQGTNPFAKGVATHPTTSSQASSNFSTPLSSNIATPTSTMSPMQLPSQPQSVQPNRSIPSTTNPFARNASPAQQQQPTAPPPSGLASNAASSTNPFRQSTFHNQQTGAGWQQGQGIMGGLEQIPTIPVFPRLGENNMQVPQQQQQQQQWQ